MAIRLEQLSSLIAKKDATNTLSRILVEYAVLKEKLNDIEKQSWYFRNALDSNQNKLEALKKEYEEIQSFYNSSTKEDFNALITEETAKIKSIREGQHSVLIKQIAFSSMNHKLELYQGLLHIKQQIPQLMDIDQYLSHPDEMLIFFDVDR